MKLIKAKNLIEASISELLKEFSPSAELQKWLEYSLLPLGKTVRGALCLSLVEDLGIEIKQEHINWASMIEIHHSYTLVHDDLPAMDDANERRGKPSCHRKFGEWQAILTGDSLLNLSYQLMGSHPYPNLSKILKEASALLNHKGIIQGQIEDLQAKGPSWEEIKSIHYKKTAALFEFVLFSTALISNNADKVEELRQFGSNLGLLFQALDDYLDKDDPKEKINLFHKHQDKANLYLGQLINNYLKFSRNYPILQSNAEEILQNFQAKIPENEWRELFKNS